MSERDSYKRVTPEQSIFAISNPTESPGCITRATLRASDYDILAWHALPWRVPGAASVIVVEGVEIVMEVVVTVAVVVTATEAIAIVVLAIVISMHCSSTTA